MSWSDKIFAYCERAGDPAFWRAVQRRLECGLPFSGVGWGTASGAAF